MNKTSRSARNARFWEVVLPEIRLLCKKEKLNLCEYSEYHFRVFNKKGDKFDFWNSTPKLEIVEKITRLKRIEKLGGLPKQAEVQPPVKVDSKSQEERLDKILFGR